MSRRARLGVTAAVLVAGASAALVLGSHEGSHEGSPSRSPSHSGTGSAQQAHLTLLAGSADYLVYARDYVLAPQLASTYAGIVPLRQVEVRRRSGSAQVLTTIGPGVDAQFSIARDTLVAGGFVTGGRVNWWNVASGDAGQMHLPPGALLTAAAPDGLLVATQRGELLLLGLNGATRSLGTPLPGTPVTSMVSGDQGAVLTDDAGHAAYLSFAQPGHIQQLQTGTQLPIRCFSLTDDYAACVGGDPGEHQVYSRAILLDLHGGPSTVVATHPVASDGAPVAVSDQGLVWLAYASRQYVHHIAAGSSNDQAVAADLSDVTTAYGTAIGVTKDGETVTRIDAELHPTRLFDAGRAPTTTSAFTLDGRRVISIDTADEPNHPESEISVHAWRLTPAGDVDRTHPPRLLAAGTHQRPIVSTMLAVCGRTYAYADANRPQSDQRTADIHVVRPQGRATIASARLDGVLQCSGHWLIYTSDPHRDRGSDRPVQLHARNLDTGEDRTVGLVPEVEANFLLGPPTASHVAAIAGNRIAYATPTGRVLVRNLRTGATVTVAHLGRSRVHTRISLYQVYLRGRHVAWFRRQHVLRGTGGTATVHRGQVSGLQPVTHAMVGVWSRGIVTESTPSRVFDFTTPRSYQIVTWRGEAVSTLPSNLYLAAPQLTLSTEAWVDPAGILQTQPTAAVRS